MFDDAMLKAKRCRHEFFRGQPGRVVHAMTSRVSEGNQDESFTLDSVNGELRLQKQLRYEVKNFYNITIQALDRENPLLVPPAPADTCACKTSPHNTLLYIYVEDVNQYAPAWSSQHTACEYKSSTTCNTYLHVLKVYGWAS